MNKLFISVRGILKNHSIFIILFLIVTVFASYRLNYRCLWHDEAYTAALAKNTLKFGYPTAYDGKSFITGLNGNDFNDEFQHIVYPWLHFYLIASSFKLFGLNEIAARLPSLLFGLLSIIGVYKLSGQISKYDKKLMLYATIIYAFSIPFLIVSRMCKYQALVMFFGVFATFHYFRFIEKQKTKNLILSIIHSIFLFYCNYVMFGTILVTLAVYHLFYIRNSYRKLLVANGIVLLFTLPWIIYIQMHNMNCLRGFFLGLEGGFLFFLDHLITSLWQLNTIFFPFIGLLILYLIIILFRFFLPEKRNITERKKFIHNQFFILLVCFTVLIYNALLPLMSNWWYISIFPFCAILLAGTIKNVFRLNTIATYIILFVISATNLLHVLPYRFVNWINLNPSKYSSIIKSPNHNGYIWDDIYRYIEYDSQFKFLLYDYLDGINSDYNSAAEGLVKYFVNDINKGEIVNSSMLSPAVLFYTDLTVVNQLDPNRDAFGPISALLYTGYPNAKKYHTYSDCEYDKIDYFIYTPSMDLPYPYLEYIKKNASKFRETYIDYPDVFDGPNFLKSPENAAGFYIYKRILK